MYFSIISNRICFLLRKVIIQMISVAGAIHHMTDASLRGLHVGMLRFVLTMVSCAGVLPSGSPRSNQKWKIKNGKWLALLGKNNFE